jgi:hypothetical protein
MEIRVLEVALLIDGEAFPVAQEHTFERHDPMIGAVGTRASAAQVADALAAADGAAAGCGRIGDKHAIGEFFELRWIAVESEPDRYPI